ncbi:hypothetical protein [Komagataeibacter medellinensis]|uniref:hypothetical protein n=1 Tax=Komagataeibacter medellinensis TaxID=1177712 RepID=UPI001E3F2A1D|nr:hypothetical protein [Komagataeibacter medellinensis]
MTKMPFLPRRSLLQATFAVATTLAFRPLQARAATGLLNVSYDPTRELYQDIDTGFTRQWAQQHGGAPVQVRTSHGGSGAQTRSVLEGAPADIVTLLWPMILMCWRTAAYWPPTGRAACP